jgi:hypothetical protein
MCGGRVIVGSMEWHGINGEWNYSQAGDCEKCDASLVRKVEPLDPDSAKWWPSASGARVDDDAELPISRSSFCAGNRACVDAPEWAICVRVE